MSQASAHFRVYVVETAGSTYVHSILSNVNLCSFFHLFRDMILVGGSSHLLRARRCVCCARNFTGTPPEHPVQM